MQKIGLRTPSVISESVEFVTTNFSDKSVITDSTKIRVARTERIAQNLVDKLRHEDGRLFYYKVAWNLDEQAINRMLASAIDKADNPARYFSRCAKNALEAVRAQ